MMREPAVPTRLGWGSVAVTVAALQAAAVAVWLAPASIHVVGWSSAGPVRVALLSSPSRLAWLATSAVVASGLLLAWASRRQNSTLVTSLPPLCLLWVWAVPYLPWLPDRLPLLLVLAGPVRWAVACAAMVWAAHAGGVWRWRGWGGLPAPGRRTLFGLSLALYLLFGSLSSRAIGPGGDEPHYLVIAHSLLADGDLKIENNHQRADYRRFFGGQLRPDYLARGQDGEIYSIHAPGLPALLLPAYAAAGYGGAVAWLCFLAALAALAGFDLADALAGRRAAWITWAGVCPTVPFVPHSWLLFPEMPGTLLVAWAVLWMQQPPERGLSTWVWRGAALGVLPWLHTKFVVLLAVLAVAFALRLWRRPRAAIGFVAPILISGVAWLYSFYAIYGVFDPQAPYGASAGESLLIANVPRGLLRLLFDQKFGLLVYSPVYLFAIAGYWLILRRPDTRRLGVLLLCVVAVFVGNTTRYYMWWGGSSAPARFLVPVLPCLAPMVALAVQRVTSPLSRALLGV